jgi:hypothetical protein
MTKTMPTRQATYLGRRCEVKEIRQAGMYGEREIRIHWIDAADPKNGGWPAGSIVSKTITGNILKGTDRELVAPHLVDEF